MHAIKEKLLRMGLLCLLAILTGGRVRQNFTGNWNTSYGSFALVSAIFAIGRCVDGLGLSEVWEREQSGNGLDF